MSLSTASSGQRDIYGWLGGVWRTTDHLDLTGPLPQADGRNDLRMVVTTCTFYGARCHNHDIPAECQRPAPVTPEAAGASSPAVVLHCESSELVRCLDHQTAR